MNRNGSIPDDRDGTQGLSTRLRNGWRVLVGPPTQGNTGNGGLLGVRDFYEMYWDEPVLLMADGQQARRLGFSSLDSEILSEIGIPGWAAPNLTFSEPKSSGHGEILIGSDGQDRPIVYRCADRNVLVLADAGVRPIAVGLDGLIFTLVMYAGMIEIAISSDRDAFIENRIPSSLVDRFRTVYCSEFAGLYEGSFIEEEVSRLASRQA